MMTYGKHHSAALANKYIFSLFFPRTRTRAAYQYIKKIRVQRNPKLQHRFWGGTCTETPKTNKNR